MLKESCIYYQLCVLHPHTMLVSPLPLPAPPRCPEGVGAATNLVSSPLFFQLWGQMGHPVLPFTSCLIILYGAVHRAQPYSQRSMKEPYRDRFKCKYKFPFSYMFVAKTILCLQSGNSP